MLKIAVIPAYEPPETFIAYAEQILHTSDRLIVVDDGSGDAYAHIFAAIGNLPGATVLTLPTNHGKGYALRYAYAYCAEQFAGTDILATADCDGQHDISDVQRVFREVAETPDALILGVRDFSICNIPPKSLIGNTQMRRWLKLLYGIEVSDSQTGLRACTVQTAQRLLKVKGDRFEYETGTLIYAKRNQIPLRQVPIRTIYPENPSDHVTHFRAFHDSMRVAGTLLSHLIPYILSSSVAAVADVLAFALLVNLVFPNATPMHTLLATVSARVFSSIINFFINCKHIFHGKAKHSIVRYYTLWFFQLCVSYGIVYLFGHVLGGQVTVVKILGDLVLCVISYIVQCRWVYRQESHTFYGGFARFCRGLLRIFSRRYRCDFSQPEEPVVYVCRHLNMHGPYATIKWLPFPVHPMALHVFFDRKTSIRHFTNYTFSQRYGKKPKSFDVAAWAVGSVTSKLVNSLQSVPVYRGSGQSVSTLKKGLTYLMKGEPLIVYADVNYTDGYDKEGPIYQGFLYLGELYYRRTGKELKFVPLYLDDPARKIVAGEPVIVNDFKQQGQSAAEMLQAAINRPAQSVK